MQNASTRPRKDVVRTAQGTASLALPATSPTSAQAAPMPTGHVNGCILFTALEPTFSHHDNHGEKVFRYPVAMVCTGDQSVRFEQRAYEQDGGHEELLDLHMSEWFAFDGLNGLDGLNGTSDLSGTSGLIRKTFGCKLPLHHTEAGKEEIYHQIRVQVRSNGVASPWSQWSVSPVLSVRN